MLRGSFALSLVREFLGRTVATREYDARIEESPGSMGRLPGNAWAPDASLATDSATENKPPSRERG